MQPINKKRVYRFSINEGNLKQCDDEVVSFAKNYYEVHFKIDYKNADGTIANYYPDFFVKTDEKTVYIVETKGREDFDDPLKIKRLAQWCDDANARQKKIAYKMLYVKQEEWDKYKPKSWNDVLNLFKLCAHPAS